MDTNVERFHGGKEINNKPWNAPTTLMCTFQSTKSQEVYIHTYINNFKRPTKEFRFRVIIIIFINEIDR